MGAELRRSSRPEYLDASHCGRLDDWEEALKLESNLSPVTRRLMKAPGVRTAADARVNPEGATQHSPGQRPINVNLSSGSLRRARVAGRILWPTAAAVGEGASKISF